MFLGRFTCGEYVSHRKKTQTCIKRKCRGQYPPNYSETKVARTNDDMTGMHIYRSKGWRTQWWISVRWSTYTAFILRNFRLAQPLSSWMFRYRTLKYLIPLCKVCQKQSWLALEACPWDLTRVCLDHIVFWTIRMSTTWPRIHSFFERHLLDHF